MPWDPSQLSGVVARWLAASATTDAGGTVPVAADGDAAYLVKDSAGARDLSQPAGPNRWLYDSARGALVSTAAQAQFGQPWYSVAPGCPFDQGNTSLFFIVGLLSRGGTGNRPFVGAAANSFQLLTGSDNSGNWPADGLGKVGVQQYPSYPHGSTPIPTRLALVGYVGSSSSGKVLVNGATETLSATLASNPTTLEAIFGWPEINAALNGAFIEAFVVNRPVTDPELALIRTYAQSRGCVFDAPSTVVYDGDSISNGFPDSLQRGWQDALALGPLALEYNNAKSGTALQTILGNAPTWTDPLVRAGKNNVAVVFAGTNDIDQLGRTAAQVYADTQSYGAGRKTAGFKVVVVGMLPRTGDETSRAALRASMLADFTASTTAPLVFGPVGGVTYADYYVDLGGDSVVGQPGQNTDATYYADGVHPTQAGYARLAGIIKPALALAGVASGFTAGPPAIHAFRRRRAG